MTGAPPPGIGLLAWQFELAWALTEYHLERLEDDDLLWEPSDVCWTLRRAPDGTWVPDFAEVEPDPVPTPTIAWTTWHVGWWWSAAIAALEGAPSPAPTDVAWPGTAARTVGWLRELRERWAGVLAQLADDDLTRTAAFPWPADDGHSLAQTVAWLNVELTKNAAEIGQLRMMRAAGGRSGGGLSPSRPCRS